MAYQKTVVWSCPSGDFATGREAVIAKNTTHIKPGWNQTLEGFENAITALVNAYASAPTRTTWDNTAKILTIFETFADEASAATYLEEFKKVIETHQMADNSGWTFVNVTGETVSDA